MGIGDVGFCAHPYKRLRYSNRAVGNLRKAHRVSQKSSLRQIYEANKDSESIAIHIVK